MMNEVGPAYEEAGENFTSQADDVAASAENLANYLDTCVAIRKRQALETQTND
jgi:hypothetical protein